ncbi:MULTISPECIES: linear amide C-N hydrolase [unclassified Roseofilum]|uniref:linear amide C-N hydrolase n=1 Tax=unclassified Roseofilum TaxID=2620099 RepID=UPI001B1CD710|nr:MULTISPECIES: linear amide C-N hydrolase [unclassified Roseofilum]MBP0007750.1 linear amide C-N hydrolase [Roseofilum sp. Belize Diploria]MBP0013901.1 linear amide C-N hydrolase [Roseofilum sp. SID3]MBP0032143.1 linear amide C-N hydrolase [Roseofilum sp. Belize BBD 4]MBP0039585.1 linear amide C-N hydrolase [Roseofilum sp. SID1]MBP0043060.1 linear amide C-N hydrolase [Roseofilum sp. SBFL]
MMKKHIFIFKKVATIFVVLITILSMAIVPPAQACSRLVYQGSSNGPITARSMDWFQDPDAKLWFFPKGMKRDGGAGTNSITWTSKYASIITSSYDIATVDGINEKGLVANLLFLEATDYGDIEPTEKTLSLGGWGQYVLDNYATVEEAVQGLESKPFQLATATFDQLVSAGLISPLPLPLQAALGGLEFALHLSLSDPSGDSAIFEYIDGELTIHHDKEYNVLTNDPIFDQQLALSTYWDQVGAGSFLPGTNNPSDRFVRASYYLHKMNEQLITKVKKDRRNELAAALGIIRNVSDPLGLASFSLGTTQWRTVADQNNINPAYFFEYTKSPNLFWVVMNNLNLEEGAEVMSLEDLTALSLVGEVSQQFQKTDPFSWDISSTL